MTPGPSAGTELSPVYLGWHHQVELGATPVEVSRALIGLRANLTSLGLPQEALIRWELVLAEVMNNIVEHAYGGSGQGSIELQTSTHGHAIWCRLRDQGGAMPGEELPRARRYDLDSMALADLPEGGFGWGLIHDLTRALSYRRAGAENHLEFRIDLDP